MTAPVTVSGVVAAHRCPLRYWHDLQRPPRESARYAVAKQIAAHLGGELDADLIWAEVTTVLPGIDPRCRELLGDWVAACRANRWPRVELGDRPVRSGKLGLVGQVDGVAPDLASCTVIRASEAPAAGIYAADRVRAAAYALCLAEERGRPPDHVALIYVPSGLLRRYVPQPRDRRAVLRALSVARRVQEGRLPPRPAGAPCTRCPHGEVCAGGARSGASLL
ncbi:MAG: Dna2/Cas4 domain-containing protein [Methanospirillum sp.]|nr:Dna2/Cas4 domain-containing protein [Methanospirillum sp.]